MFLDLGNGVVQTRTWEGENGMRMGNLIKAILGVMVLAMTIAPLAEAASIYADVSQVDVDEVVTINVYLDISDEAGAVDIYNFNILFSGLSVINTIVATAPGLAGEVTVGGDQNGEVTGYFASGGGGLEIHVATMTVTGGTIGETLTASTFGTTYHEPTYGTYSFSGDIVTTVPEPGTALLMGLGLVGMAAAGRKRS